MSIRDWVRFHEDGYWSHIADHWMDQLVDALNWKPVRDQAIAKNNANQSIADVTYTLVDFQTETRTPPGYTWNGADNTLTVPANGLYLVEASVRWASSNVGSRVVNIATDQDLSGTLALTTDDHRPAVYETMGDTGVFVQRVHSVIEFDGTGGKSIGVFVYQSSGGALNVETANNYTYLKVTRLR